MSDLLKMSLALEDDQLGKRVHAAVILRAQAIRNQDSDQGDFAQVILADLNRRWGDFIIRVASDSEVQTHIALAPDNRTIFATNVTDDKIKQLVQSEMAHAAKRVTPRPEPENNEGEGKE